MPRLSAIDTVRNQKAHQAHSAARAMNRIGSASLLALEAQIHQAQNKQNPPEFAAHEGFTNPRQVMADGTAASAQSDTYTR